MLQLMQDCGVIFGGKKEEKNETIKETAIRECYEESNGFIGTKHNIKKVNK